MLGREGENFERARASEIAKRAEKLSDRRIEIIAVRLFSDVLCARKNYIKIGKIGA